METTDTPAPEAAANIKTGPTVIAAYLRSLTNAPGVYRMLDTTGEVIYVGKARALKNRVSNYARLGGHTNRIARMISATASMEFVTVRTEAEALLLEANLIKRFKPRFNVLMRDDKSFPYIRISRDHPAPQVMKHRGARTIKGDYFGPFASAGAVSRTINMVQRAFLLRTCSDSVYESRTRPCLLYQIKRCSGPCTGEISLDNYNKLADEAVRSLKGEGRVVREMYQRLMHDASEKLEFEAAAKYRNRLWALAHVTADQSINPDGVEEADVFAAHQEGGHICIQVFFFRSGQNWGNRAYYPKAGKSFQIEEILESFVAQFYDDKPVPRLLLLSHDLPDRALMTEALSSKVSHKIAIHVPDRGTKSTLVEHAAANAREALGRRLAESSSQTNLLQLLAGRFKLAQVPRRIDVFDNSHIAGTNAVGAMIVAGREGFVKGQYRKFNIKSAETAPGDDYAMMREVLTRRLKRVVDDASAEAPLSATGEIEDAFNDDEAFPSRPDLILVDGGQGQLAVATAVIADLGITGIDVIGVAKGPERDAGREHFFMPGAERPVMLEAKDPVLYFVQRLRDEAHRFAIGAHRAKRSKVLGLNPLDEIEGIGPTRKRALLKHFGSAKAVSRAGVEDLKIVDGISAELAGKIYAFFHERAS